jgi:hypothetical protein
MRLSCCRIVQRWTGGSNSRFDRRKKVMEKTVCLEAIVRTYYSKFSMKAPPLICCAGDASSLRLTRDQSQESIYNLFNALIIMCNARILSYVSYGSIERRTAMSDEATHGITYVNLLHEASELHLYLVAVVFKCKIENVFKWVKLRVCIKLSFFKTSLHLAQWNSRTSRTASKSVVLECKMKSTAITSDLARWGR